MRARPTISAATLVLAAALPLLFLHSTFQPSVSVDIAGSAVTAYLSDFAMLAVVVAASATMRAPRGARALWLVAAAFFVWVAFEVAWGRHVAAEYAVMTHATTAAKFVEYALLAPAAAILVRTRDELVVVLATLVAWSCVASAIGIAQFFGSHVAGGKGVAGHRQGSFLSVADFAALSSATLVLAAVALAVRGAALPRPLAIAALVSGATGTVLAGAMTSVLGLATAFAVLGGVALARRQLALRAAAAVTAVAVATAVGVVAIRSNDLAAFARFVGASTKADERGSHIETYSHHTLLAWIGYRIWRDHPLAGVGWQASAEPANYMPVVPAAQRRFPNEAARAFPSPSPHRRYGVQNVWVQALADLGAIGFLLWGAVFATAAALAVRSRTALPGLLALGWIALAAWLWTSQGFVAGIPLDALAWLAIGLAAATVRQA